MSVGSVAPYVTAERSQTKTNSQNNNPLLNSLLGGNNNVSSDSESVVSYTNSVLKNYTYLQDALKALSEQTGDRITFEKLAEYAEQKQKEFSDKIHADLLAKGIDPEINFRVVAEEGKDSLTVVSDHKDAAKVQAYFDANPELKKEFATIQALTSMEKARKQMQINPQAVRSQTQLEAVSNWWAENGNQTSQIFDYNNIAPAFLNGVRAKV